ncbi:MAG: hypothetical protein R2788_26295 [Saprospiraceae bacterium]
MPVSETVSAIIGGYHVVGEAVFFRETVQFLLDGPQLRIAISEGRRSGFWPLSPSRCCARLIGFPFPVPPFSFLTASCTWLTISFSAFQLARTLSRNSLALAMRLSIS